MVLDTESDTVHIYRQMIVRPSAALQQAQPPSAGQAAFSFTCLGGLPHCQQRCLPLLFLRRSVTKELAPEWSGVVETCCGRLSCWQWGRPPLVHSWGWGAAQARCKGSVFFKRKFSFTCLGGLPHCQQLSLPQHVSDIRLSSRGRNKAACILSLEPGGTPPGPPLRAWLAGGEEALGPARVAHVVALY